MIPKSTLYCIRTLTMSMEVRKQETVLGTAIKESRKASMAQEKTPKTRVLEPEIIKQ